MSIKKIKSLKDLYKELDNLYKGIHKFCKICKEEDCKGYVWLLPKETEEFVNKNIPLVEINKKLNFLDSFSRKNGIINVEEVKPPCVFRGKRGKCTIYPIRPLICRLYPLDFKILKNQYHIVLHTDCLFVKRLIENKNIGQFFDKIINIFYNLNRILLKKILEEYKLIDSISKYPENYKHNDYIKLLKVVNLKRGKVKVCQNVKQFLTLKK
jgi:Fe-S-cluster containining protein